MKISIGKQNSNFSQSDHWASSGSLHTARAVIHHMWASCPALPYFTVPSNEYPENPI